MTSLSKAISEASIPMSAALYGLLLAALITPDPEQIKRLFEKDQL